MAQPPILTRLIVEDFQDAPEWLPRLFVVINRFMEQTNSAFDKNITYGDNIFARAFSTSYTTDAAYFTGTFPQITFSWVSSDLPRECQVTRVQHADGTPFLGSVGVPDWIYNQGNIVIRYVPGLAPGTKYTLSFSAK